MFFDIPSQTPKQCIFFATRIIRNIRHIMIIFPRILQILPIFSSEDDNASGHSFSIYTLQKTDELLLFLILECLYIRNNEMLFFSDTILLHLLQKHFIRVIV